MQLSDRPLRIALLSYRAHPEVGGQGVYVRQLSRGLKALGHHVTVLAGPPYPELDEGVGLLRVPSLDLYRPADPFRRPARREFRGPIDVAEYAAMCTGSFPEPLTFSLRAARVLAAGGFDVVHDNQSLGYGLLQIARRVPLVATIHHPISVDRRLEIAGASSWAERVGRRRWYSFVRMQARVARRLTRIITVSGSARRDIVTDFGVRDDRIRVIPNGVDADLFRPVRGLARVPGRIVTVASSALPSKGLEILVEAVAKLRTERPEVRLVIVGKGGEAPAVRRAVERLGVEDAVTSLGRVAALDVVRHLGEAQVAVVPSLYEGFSLPAIEAMSCGVPLVTTRAGALPEVVGDAAVTVTPGDPAALAEGLRTVLADPLLAARLSVAGRARVLARYTWTSAARATVEEYGAAMKRC